jgi:hypothetical protein
MNEIRVWLEKQIIAEFPGAIVLEFWEGERHLKHYANNKLTGISGASEWEFTPDFVATFEYGGGKNIAFMNFTSKTLGLTELGELHVFAKIASPLLAVQATVNGLSKDLYSLLLDKGVQERLLGYAANRRILVGQWNEKAGSIPEENFFPPKGF